MPRAIRFLLVLVSVLCLLTVLSCGKDKRVTRVDPDVVTDLSGRWNDTDSKLVAEAMMKDLSANDVEAAMQIILGSARSMGIEVK